MGKRSRAEKAQYAEAEAEENTPVPECPLCDRPIPKDVPQAEHHLIPRSKGGKNSETILVHEICQREIYSVLKENQIARDFNTVQALREHPPLAKFFAWIGKRPPEFTSKVR